MCDYVLLLPVKPTVGSSRRSKRSRRVIEDEEEGEDKNDALEDTARAAVGVHLDKSTGQSSDSTEDLEYLEEQLRQETMYV